MPPGFARRREKRRRSFCHRSARWIITRQTSPLYSAHPRIALADSQLSRSRNDGFERWPRRRPAAAGEGKQARLQDRQGGIAARAWREDRQRNFRWGRLRTSLCHLTPRSRAFAKKLAAKISKARAHAHRLPHSTSQQLAFSTSASWLRSFPIARTKPNRSGGSSRERSNRATSLRLPAVSVVAKRNSSKVSSRLWARPHPRPVQHLHCSTSIPAVGCRFITLISFGWKTENRPSASGSTIIPSATAFR